MFEKSNAPKQEELTNSINTKVFPNLNLKEKKETLEKLSSLLSELEKGYKLQNNLTGEEKKDDEDLNEVYETYMEVIGNILPAGFAFEEISLPKSNILWRGTDPVVIFSLLSEKDSSLVVKSEFPNVAHRWETSLSYGVGKTAFDLPFVFAFGFSRPKNLKTIKREDSAVYKDVIETTEGDIDFANVQEIAIRLKGKKPGKVFPPKFYRLVQKEQQMAA